MSATLKDQLKEVQKVLVEKKPAIGLRALSGAARSALDAAVPAVAGAETALIHSDVVQADLAMEVLDRHLGEARDAVRLTTIEIVAAHDSIAAVRAEALDTVRGSLDILATQVANLNSASGVNTSDAVALKSADAAMRAIDGALRAATSALSRFREDVRDELPAAVSEPLASATIVVTDAHRLASWMSSLRRAIEATHRKVAELGGSDPALANGEFLKALHAAHPPSPGRYLAPIARAGIQSRSTDVENLPPEPPPSKAAAVTDVIPPGRLVIPGTSMWVVRGAKALQYVATLIILPGVAWYLYADSFIGTVKELVAIGATGFLTDASLGSATAWLGKVKKP